MANRAGQLAREWIGRKIAGDSSAITLSQMKRQYYMEQLGSGAAKSDNLDVLEKKWLRKWIVDNGGTPVGNYNSDLWAQAVAILSTPVSKNQTENQVLFYLNAS